MKHNDLSFIILAGGKSSRMGFNKAELNYNGKTFLNTLILIAQTLHFNDIMISGYSVDIKSTLSIKDEFIDRGPLGGMYSCFKASKNETCFLTCVDVPEITKNLISSMIIAHEKSGKQITLLSQNGKIEPLIGVYPTSIYEKIYSIIKNESAPVFRLLDHYDFGVFELNNKEHFIKNINTPEDYAKIKKKK
jgi:molybdopterin-guanine dinucleotide biosynthesis protein A